MPDAETSRLTREGIAAVRRGDKAAARRSLLEAVERDRHQAQAWLWLSAALDEPEQQAICLQNVLKIDPGNQAARRGLSLLGETPSVMPSIQSLTSAAPHPEPGWQTPLEHGAPAVIDKGMNAMLSGEPQPIPAKEPQGEDSWRASLYDPEMVSEATLVGTKTIEKPDLSFMDLVNTWIDLLILNPHGGLDNELAYGGGPGRIAINVVTAAALSILASVVGTVMLLMLPAAGVNLPLITSANAFIERAATSAELDMPPDASVTLGQMEAELGPLVASSGVMIAASACLIIPMLLVGLFIYAFFVNGVSRMANGKGTFGKTFTGLSLGLVSAQFTSVILAVLLPLMPLGMALIVALLVSFYQLMIYAVPVGRAHRFGMLASLGMLILGQIAASVGMGLIFGCLGIGLSMLAR